MIEQASFSPAFRISWPIMCGCVSPCDYLPCELFVSRSFLVFLPRMHAQCISLVFSSSSLASLQSIFFILWIVFLFHEMTGIIYPGNGENAQERLRTRRENSISVLSLSHYTRVNDYFWFVLPIFFFFTSCHSFAREYKLQGFLFYVFFWHISCYIMIFII